MLSRNTSLQLAEVDAPPPSNHAIAALLKLQQARIDALEGSMMDVVRQQRAWPTTAAVPPPAAAAISATAVAPTTTPPAPKKWVTMQKHQTEMLLGSVQSGTQKAFLLMQQARIAALEADMADVVQQQRAWPDDGASSLPPPPSRFLKQRVLTLEVDATQEAVDGTAAAAGESLDGIVPPGSSTQEAALLLQQARVDALESALAEAVRKQRAQPVPQQPIPPAAHVAVVVLPLPPPPALHPPRRRAACSGCCTGGWAIFWTVLLVCLAFTGLIVGVTLGCKGKCGGGGGGGGADDGGFLIIGMSMGMFG